MKISRAISVGDIKVVSTKRNTRVVQWLRYVSHEVSDEFQGYTT